MQVAHTKELKTKTFEKRAGVRGKYLSLGKMNEQVN